MHAEIDEVFAGGGDLAGAIEQVARLGAQLLLQSALESEVTTFLGRDRYALREPCPGIYTADETPVSGHEIVPSGGQIVPR